PSSDGSVSRHRRIPHRCPQCGAVQPVEAKSAQKQRPSARGWCRACNAADPLSHYN
ncbi:hypothetical protein EMIHUDRAFT_351826, partial [Emiliania huxleyi CCMP1516]|uniref:Uncharacterized protein n=2 Tax=Emiliania huxleyi TaxID=2903 RepID=A0A0D3KLW6_EMIH1